ncbi:MAG: hypothetical protein Kow0059_01900 [Candidatus Sumerlaeia bacterium]
MINLLPAATASGGALLCAVAVQALSPAAMRWAIGAAWLAVAAAVVCPEGLSAIGRRFTPTAILTAALGALWLAGFDSPFHWDAVQTVIRARHFWETGEMERFSLLFPVLAPVAAAFPSSTAAPHVFMMACGVGALAAVGTMARRLAGRAWGLRAVLLGAAFAPLWFLYRFVMLEGFLVFLWTLALLASLAWSRRLSLDRAGWLTSLVLLTAAAKETGALVVIPVLTALVILAPRGRRRRRLTAALIPAVGAALISAGAAWRFAKLRGIENYFSGVITTDRGLTFLPFNAHLPRPWIDVVFGVAFQQLFFWAQTGLIVPVTLAFVRPRSARASQMLVISGMAVQAFWTFLTPHHKWADVHTFPLFGFNSPGLAAGGLLFYLIMVFGLVARGDVRVRFDRRAVVLLAGVLPLSAALLVFAKTAPAGGGGLHVWLQWHYLMPAVAGAFVLGVMGLRRAERFSLSPWTRRAALGVLVLATANGLIGTAGIVGRFRAEDCARAEAYVWMLAQPERIVYTHWPFAYLGTGLDFRDNGPLAWERDGWKVRSMYELADLNVRPENGSLLLYDVARSYAIPRRRVEILGGAAHAVEIEVWRPSLLAPAFPVKRERAVLVRRYP